MALSYSTGLVHGVLGPSGSSLSELLRGFVIDIYSNATMRPTTADDGVPSGSVLLGTVTKGGVPATGDPSTYWLSFGEPVGRAIDKHPDETWQFTAGVVPPGALASWFRLRLVADTQGSTGYRIDGTVGAGATSDARLSDTAIVSGNIYTFNTFRLSWPR
jgi:hypothetical protein